MTAVMGGRMRKTTSLGDANTSLLWLPMPSSKKKDPAKLTFTWAQTPLNLPEDLFVGEVLKALK